jgi:hypothetical protein
MGIGFLQNAIQLEKSQSAFPIQLGARDPLLGKKRAGPMPCSEFLMLFALCPRDFSFIRVAAVNRAVGLSSQDLDRMLG